MGENGKSSSAVTPPALFHKAFSAHGLQHYQGNSAVPPSFCSTTMGLRQCHITSKAGTRDPGNDSPLLQQHHDQGWTVGKYWLRDFFIPAHGRGIARILVGLFPKIFKDICTCNHDPILVMNEFAFTHQQIFILFKGGLGELQK